MKKCVWLFAAILPLCASGQRVRTNDTQQWIGCYELHVAAADTAKQLWGKLPEHFELTVNRNNDFVVTSLDRGPAWVSGWRPLDENSASVNWGTYFVTYLLTLSKSGDALTGTVHLNSDTGDQGLPEFKVDVHRFACKNTVARVAARKAHGL